MEKSKTPLPANEEKRLEALKSYAVLDTLPEKEFDDITRLASTICGTPITLIGLIDESRQWFKSIVGMEGTETPRNLTFCQYAIVQDEILEVEDASKDERFAKNPFVTGYPDVRFYAGAPLRTEDGYNIGTLCVIDTQPNKLNSEQREALTILANQVVRNMELRKEKLRVENEKQLLTEANDLLNTFFENSPSNITMRDLNGHYLYANGHALKSINKTASEFIGRPVYDLMPKALADKLLADDQEVINTKKGIQREYRNGEGESARYYTSNLFPLMNADHKPYGVGTITNDITEAKKTAGELERSNERFMSMFHHNPVGMAIFSEKDKKITHVNQTFLHLFDFDSESEVFEKSIGELMLSGSGELDLRKKMIDQQGFLQNEEILTQSRKGKELALLCSVNRIQLGEQNVLLVSYTDITERKKLEREIKATNDQLTEAKKEAEQATLSKSLFLANMSHEIRTPLNAMLGFADLLDTTQLNDQQRDYLEAIDISGKNLLTIINDILDFSKIEAGMLSIENVPFGLHPLIHSVYTMFFAKAQNKNLKLFISLDPKLPSLVHGDPTRLNQVLINLIGNAVKFTAEGSISVGCEVTEKTAEAVKLRISVKDTGIGISTEKIATIFDRFTQAESDTTRNFGGTGLGLSIAKKLIELQGGEIHVESTPGQGSEFYFTIEYKIADEKEYTAVKKPQQKVQAVFTGKKVLIVEDNLLNQKLALTVLKNEGFEVEIAENGQLAVDFLKERTYDIILMDLQMPILDGYQATKKIRRELHVETPIIAMTANAMAGEQERCIDAGMDDYITKPFKSESLMNMIFKHLNERPGVVAASAAAPARITDLGYLRDFSGGKGSFVKEMVEVFLDQNPRDMEAIEDALKNDDYDVMKAISHSLQTSLGFIGFSDSLIHRLKESEVLATEKRDLATIRTNLEIIVQTCKQARKELAEELKYL